MTGRGDLSRGFPKVDDALDPMSEEDIRKAQLTVCGRARDLEDATKLLEILGIYPGQPEPMSVNRRSIEIRTERRPRLIEITRKRKEGLPLTEEEIHFLESGPPKH